MQSMYDAVQRCSRTKMVLPLRVWVDDRCVETSSAQWAHTIDTSDIGCRLGGLRTELRPGQVVTLQRGPHKAPFRVIWNKQLEPRENQAGVEALDHNLNIWLVNPPNPAASEPAGSSPSAVPVPTTSTKSASVAPRPEQTSMFGAARQRLRWCLGAAFVLFSMASGSYLYFQIFPTSQPVAILPPAPVPPTAQDLARLTPKPHLMPASLTQPLQPSASRVETAEAPTGRIVYPQSPDDIITGKVRLQIVIAANGLVKQIHLLSGKQPLAEAAADAVRLWHYASSTGNDSSAERETSVTVSFLGDAVSLQFPHMGTAGTLSKAN